MIPARPNVRSLFSRALLTLSIAALLLGACASSSSPQMAADKGSAESAPEEPRAESAGGERGFWADSASAAPQQRIVIKNANISLVVNDPAASMDAISQMAEEMGGFVVSANLYHTQLSDGRKVPRGSITVRVPAQRLQEALALIEAQSEDEPQSRTIESQDVTSEYTDLESRLRNLESAEAQLTEILERAAKTEDVLSVYNELTQVREQIEVIKGKMQYYEQSAALSAVHVELNPAEAVASVTIAGWEPAGVAKDAVQSLINTLQFLLNAAIWMVIYVLPVFLVFYLIVVLPITLLWRRFRRSRRAKQSPESPNL